jgi:hypothetical protein
MKVKHYYREYDSYKTERQWAHEGFVITESAEGIELLPSKLSKQPCKYYKPDEVRKATKEQLNTFFKPDREKAKAYRERKKAEKEQERQEKEQERQVIEEKLNYYQELVERLTKLTKELYPKKEYPKEIVIDTETTGLDTFEDELLQVSIIDTDGNVVFDSYFKPIRHNEWYEAQNVNHISPEMVADAPTIYEKAAEINAIISQADLVIGYNVGFDLMMLANNGVISIKDIKSYDVMERFAKIYGEWSEWYQNYKWQSLARAAEYCGYDWSRQNGKEHNSLADCFATLFVKQNMELCKKEREREEQEERKKIYEEIKEFICDDENLKNAERMKVSFIRVMDKYKAKEQWQEYLKKFFSSEDYKEKTKDCRYTNVHDFVLFKMEEASHLLSELGDYYNGYLFGGRYDNYFYDVRGSELEWCEEYFGGLMTSDFIKHLKD